MTSASPENSSYLGILAGEGELPFIAARNALDAGEKVVLLSFTDQRVPPDLVPYNHPIVITRLYSSFFKMLKKMHVNRLVLLGKAKRDILFDNPKFDLRTIWLLLRMKSQSDYNIFETIASEVQKLGIEILPQTRYLHNLNLPPGRYGKRLNHREFKDCIFALKYAQMVNEFDIGQTVVVGSLSVLALEGAEGTDKCILRGGKLYYNKGAVVCKLAKKNHDARFDIPAIGLRTIKSMKDSGCRVLIFETDGAIVVDPHRVLARARDAGMTLISIQRNQKDMNAYLKKLIRKMAVFK